MLVKRYHAKDMQEVMDTVVRELGSDAVVLSNRKIRQKGFKGIFKKPLIEAMVAYDPAKVPLVKKTGGTGVYGDNGGGSYAAHAYGETARPAPDWRAEPAAKAKPGAAAQTEWMENLDNRIDSLDNILNNFIHKFSHVKRDITYDYPEEIEELVCRLIENQVREELAHQLAKETEAILRRQPGATAKEIMAHLIGEMLGAPDPVQPKKFKQTVILFLGPTGVGKTTSLVKLAANMSVKQKKRVGIINTDTYRIAAQQQLKTYADILSIPLSIVYQMSELEAALETMADREVVFIDTAGKRPGDEQHREDVKAIVDIANPEELLLCVPATTGFAALREVVDTYAPVKQFKLVVTKMDETKYRGMVLNLSWYARKNIAYVTTGQNVPDDIEIVDTEQITTDLLKQHG